jgi:hypothetical protein
MVRRRQEQAIMAASVALVVAGVVVLVSPDSGSASGSPAAATARQPGVTATAGSTSPAVGSLPQASATPSGSATDTAASGSSSGPPPSGSPGAPSPYDERDRVYFNPAVGQAKADGLRALGQFKYYDALVMHGPGSDPLSFGGIRAAALRKAEPPSQGGDETAYLNAFLDARKAAMQADPSHQDTSRVDTEQRPFPQAGNLSLNPPLHWSTPPTATTTRSLAERGRFDIGWRCTPPSH